MSQAIPTVVVQHEEKGFAQKHRGIKRHHLFKRRSHVLHKAGIERQKRTQHDTAKQRRDRERKHPDAKNIATESIVACSCLRITTGHAQKFQEKRKQRQRQDKPSEIGMLLGDEPDDNPVIERLPLWVSGYSFCGRRALRGSFDLIIDVVVPGSKGGGIRTSPPRRWGNE